MLSRALWRRRSAACVLAALALAEGLPTTVGQVVLDGTLGPGGPLNGPHFQVASELGATRGHNLFHSFAQFNLRSGEVATFSGPPQIRNILSRVTGGEPSSIDGGIRSDISGANLFLINPSGVLFGPHAFVDVSGSFAVSTANYLKLADGARFVAALDADDSLLSTAPVAAFGFLEGANGNLEVRGPLRAAPECSLAVIGGAVTVADGARLEAVNGQIDLVGVSGPGEVTCSFLKCPANMNLSPSPARWAPSPQPDAPQRRSRVGERAGVRGQPPGSWEATFLPSSSPAGAGSSLTGGGAVLAGAGGAAEGSVVIRGGRLVVENASVIASATGGNIELELTESLAVVKGGQITTGSSGPLKGGDIRINAPSVLIDGQDGPAPTRIAAETASDDPQGKGGNIVVRSESVALRRGAEVSVSTFGAADAGRVEITALSLQVQGSDLPQFPTQISANAAPMMGTASGAGGQIVIRADAVELSNGAGILAATAGDADAGSIVLEADSLRLNNGAITTFTAGAGEGGAIQISSQTVTLDGPFASITALTTGLNNQSPAGNGGVVNLKTGSLQVLNDAAISATTFGDGQGGDINITADSVLLDTATFQPGSLPGITAASEPSFFGEGGGGRGGDIAIETGTLILRNGVPVSTTTRTSGAGGNIDIHAGTVALETQASIQSASLSSGRAGSLSLQSVQHILLTGGGTVSTSAPESSGGDIQVQAGGDIQLVESQITAQAGPGGGGNITLTAPSLVYLLDSTLTAQAVGDGGNLTVVDPVFFILNHAGLISKSSTANGGNITILSDYFFPSASLIDASAPFGLPGTVSVSAPEVDLSGSLVQLPANLLGAETQLRPDCAVRLSGNVSTFVLLGRGGLPIEPGGFVPSAIVFVPDEEL